MDPEYEEGFITLVETMIFISKRDLKFWTFKLKTRR